MGPATVSGLLAAVTFLTRVPLPVPAPNPSMLPWFPVIGALVGLVAAAVYVVASLVLTPFVAAALAVATTILVTGALHEDGLADATDAWGGAADREATLRILRDPAHGTYGVLAVVLSVILRIAALASLTPAIAVAVLPAVHAISRGVTVALLRTMQPAREDGLAHAVAAGASSLGAALAIGATAALGIGLLGTWFVPAAAVAATAGWLVRWLAVRRIGGITGDVLGAAEQLVEASLLILFAAALPS
jgi:adenosylcobinamide-GDP ribazoletransferase